MGEQVKCSWSQNLPGEQMINLVSKNYELRKFVPGWMTKKDWIQLDLRPAVSDTTAVTLVEAFI